MRRARPKQQQQQQLPSLQQQQQQSKQPNIMITIIIIIIKVIIKVIIALSADVVTAPIWQPVATAKGRTAATFRRIRKLANWQMGKWAHWRIAAKAKRKIRSLGKLLPLNMAFGCQGGRGKMGVTITCICRSAYSTGTRPS